MVPIGTASATGVKSGPAYVHGSSAARIGRVPKLVGLDGDDFRHPLDQQNTGLLRSLPGLESMARSVLGGPSVEQALYLENIGAAVKVGESQLPSVYTLLLEACETLSMEIPGLYVRQVRLTVCTRLGFMQSITTNVCALVLWPCCGMNRHQP